MDSAVVPNDLDIRDLVKLGSTHSGLLSQSASSSSAHDPSSVVLAPHASPDGSIEQILEGDDLQDLIEANELLPQRKSRALAGAHVAVKRLQGDKGNLVSQLARTQTVAKKTLAHIAVAYHGVAASFGITRRGAHCDPLHVMESRMVLAFASKLRGKNEMPHTSACSDYRGSCW